MTPPMHTVLESSVLVALDKLGPEGTVAGWVGVARLRKLLPMGCDDRSLDTVIRRLVRRDLVQLLMDRYPPTAAHQAVRRIGAS